MEQEIYKLANELKTSLTNGLTTQEAKIRLHENGFNIFSNQKKVNWILKFLSQLMDPMILILIFAAIISFLLKEIIDASIILFVVILNSIIGFAQEKKAYKALESLKSLASPHTLVKRDGKIIQIAAEEVVVGDIIIVNEGDIIPSDALIISLNGLKVNESSLTGESLPVEKRLKCSKEDLHRLDTLYASSDVLEGKAEALCFATGKDTLIGKIASLTMKKKEKTPLEKKLAFLSKVLGIITICICIAMFIISLLRKEDFFDTLISSISLGVAAIPEGLSAVVTIVLSLGVQKMVNYNAIVSKLPSVETLGSVTCICTDKTGTLTENKMKIEKAYFDGECQDFTLYKDEIILFLLCSNISSLSKDPLEKAIVELAKNLNINLQSLEEYKRLDEEPFSSEKKYMRTTNLYKNEKVIITKGAPEIVLEECNYISLKNKRLLNQFEKQKINTLLDKYASQALRIIALSLKKQNETIFVGLLAFKDPLRKEAKASVLKIQEASIKVKMITGDYKNTAYAIANELGIATSLDQVIEGKEIDNLSEEEFLTRLKTVTTFARVSPLHKMKIVKGYKKLGEVVAMTGDGVNDAPSLKEADVGIAMGKIGTDVAKDASDIVLRDDRFETIVAAIEEGRTIYANIKKAILFLLSSNIAEVFVMFAALLLKLPLPLLAIQILFVNLISDSLPALALGMDKKEADVMKQVPRKRNDNIFSQGGTKILITYASIIFLLTMFAYFLIPLSKLALYDIKNINDFFNTLNLIFQDKETLIKSRTFAFVTLSLTELFHMINMSSPHKSLLSILKKKNYVLIITFFIGFFIQYALCSIPLLCNLFQTSLLNPLDWLVLLIISSFPLLFHEIVKKEI